MSNAHAVDHLLAIGCIAAQLICLACFVVTRAVRVLPTMLAFLTYNVAAISIGSLIYNYGDGRSYWLAYVLLAIIGNAVEAAVGWDLASGIVDIRTAEGLHRMRRTAVCTLVAFALCALAMAYMVSYRDAKAAESLFLHYELGFAIFRALMFMAILALAYIWRIGWNDQRTQIVANLSIFSFVALLDEIAHECVNLTHYEYSAYVMIERLRDCAWIVSMLLLSWQLIALRNRERVQTNREGETTTLQLLHIARR